MGQGQLWLIFVFAIKMLKFSNEKELFAETGLEAKKSSRAKSGENWSANQILGFGYSLEIPD